MGGGNGDRRLIFTYGTLKRGFPNHHLIEELVQSGDASFVGVYHTSTEYPLVCGPYCIPFLLDIPGKGERVCGEIYAASSVAIERMDDLEGIAVGHYERLPIRVCRKSVSDVDRGESVAVVEAEAYFGHRNYAAEMWRRCGEKGSSVYSEEDARGYVKLIDGPQGTTTFLGVIRSFLTSGDENHKVGIRN